MTTEKSMERWDLNDYQRSRIEQINSKVGPIYLAELADNIKTIALALGKEISIPDDGFRSLYEPKMLDVPMEKFMARKGFCPDKARLTAAVSRVRKHLKGLGKIEPVGLDVAYDSLLQTKENNFAGLPTMGKKCDDIDALKRAEQCWRGKCPPPVVIGHRGKNTTVARAVWMFPFEWHIVEAAFFLPIQEVFKAKVPIYAADNAVSRRAVFRGLATSGQYRSKIGMDYSSFDASIGTQLIGISFSLLREHLLVSDVESKVWDRVATYFATCPYYNQYGELVVGRRGGVPSGSMFTQMIDTIVNAIVIEYAIDCEDKRYYVYGDDSLIFLPDTVEMASNRMQTVKTRAKELGVLVNLVKTHVVLVTDVTVFLGHYDLRNGRPVDEVLARLVYPERPSKDHGTAAGLMRRVVSYMAESDEAMSILMPLYHYLKYKIGGYNVDLVSLAKRAILGFATVEMGSLHPRDASGLVQFLLVNDPTLASSYFRIRAAI